MRIRPKLSGAPLGYTLSLVEGTADAYKAFTKAAWREDGTDTPRLKELMFIRISIINRCPT